jgi:hypothetical protein
MASTPSEENSNTTDYFANVAANSGSKQSKDIEFEEMLRSADELIAKSRLGVYGTFLSPFTYQFKTSIRLSYPTEKSTFDEVDKNQRKAIRDALKMRWFTFSVFVLWSIIVLPLPGLVGSAVGSSAFVETPIGLATCVGAFALVSGLAWIARYLFRERYIRVIKSDATHFANYFFKALSGIHDRAINAVRASTEDLMMTPSWPERSAGWIKIALWHSKRYENLDRYVTAASWKVESRYRQIEQHFVFAKYAVALMLTAVCFVSLQAISGFFCKLYVCSAMLMYLVGLYYFWGLRRRKSNAIWGETFLSSVIGFDEQKEHIHDQIAQVVAADKKYYMGGQKNVGKER